MDLALLKKMNVYAPEQDIAGLATDGQGESSTLIKADISLFHKMPEKRETSKPAPVEPGTDEAKVESDDTVPDVEPISEPQYVADPEPEPVQTKNDYQAGFDAGIAKSDSVHSDTLNLLQNAVNAMQADVKNAGQIIEHSHLSSVASCLRKIFPTLVKRETEAQLIAILKQACSGSGHDAVTLFVHAEDLAEIEELCVQKSLNVSVTTDSSLERGQIRAVWGEGGADIDCKKIADEFMHRLEQSLPDLIDVQPLETSDD